MAANEIQAILTAEDKSYTSNLQKAMKATDSFAQKVSSGIGFGALLRIGEKAIDKLGSSVTGLISDIDSTNAAWKSFASNMEMIGRGNEIAKVKKELQDFAAQTVYTSADMAQTYSQLAAVGTKSTDKLVMGFGMVAAAAENPQQAMKTLSTQATQMAAKPTVAWQDFKLMLEQTPAGIAQVAKAMGMSTTELVSAVQDGKVKTEEFFDAIIKAADSEALQKMAKQYKTIGQAADGVRATLVNRLAPSWDKVNQLGIKRLGELMGAMGKIDADALANKVGAAVDKVDKYIDKMIATVEKAGGIKNVLLGVASAVGAMSMAFSLSGKTMAPAMELLGSSSKTMLTTTLPIFKKLTLFPVDLAKGFVAGFGEAAAAAGIQLPRALSTVLSMVNAFKGKFGVAFGAIGKVAKVSLAALSPALLVAGIIVGLGMLDGAFGEQIDKMIETATTKGSQIITKLGQSITAKLPELMSRGTDMLVNIMNGISANIPAIITQGVSIVQTLVQGLISALPQLIPAAINMVGQLLIGLAQALPQLVASGFKLIASLVQGIVNNLPQIISIAGQVIVSLAQGIIQNLPSILQSGFEILVSLGKGILQALTLIPSIVKSVFTAIKSAITGNKGDLENTSKESGKAIATGVASGAKSQTGTFASMNNNINAQAKKLQAPMNSTAKTIGSGFSKGISTSVNGTKINTTSVSTSLNATKAPASTAGTQTGQGFAKGINSTSGQAGNAAKAASNAAIKPLQGGYSKAYSAGANISKGFAAGMRSQLAAIESAASRMAAAADKAVKAKAKIKSPSRVTMKSGRYFGEGFAIGIDKADRYVKQAVRGMMDITSMGDRQLAMAGMNNVISDDWDYNVAAQYEIVVPLQVDDREIARATASSTRAEQRRLERMENRRQGIR